MTKAVPVAAQQTAIGGTIPATLARTGRPAENAFSRLASLQSSVGNQGMLKLIGGGVLQRKLTINQPGDIYEQEADRVADTVMRMPDPKTVSKQYVTPVGSEEEAAGSSSMVMRTAGGGTVSSQYLTAVEQKEKLQRCACGKSSSGACEECAKNASLQRRTPSSAPAASPGATAPPIVHSILRSSGQPLDAETRSFMEPRFGQDFSGVRVHTDAQAAESTRAVGALAYAVGHHVVFAEGQYQPGDSSKRALLAHELVHVVQQGATKKAASAAMVTLARTPSLQRFTCDHGVAPGMTCADAQGTTRPLGFDVDRFATDSHHVTATQRTQIAAFKAAWDAAGSADDAEVHGYASCDGTGNHNLQLSCDRAEAVKTELVGMGVGTTIQTFAHGETDEFGSHLVDNHKVIIKLVTRPPQTVTIPHVRGTATPTAMTADRIPPRVSTPVTVAFGGTPNPAAPVTLSIDGGSGTNGTATINGGASQAFTVSGAQTVNLSGVTQTTPGSAGGLTLVARQRGAILASSAGFSVSSIPQNLSFTFAGLVTGATRGIRTAYAWQSDSGVQADLDQAEQSERVQVIQTGCLAGRGSHTSCYISSIVPQVDTHDLPVLHCSGVELVFQAFMFKDKRAGAINIPMTNSGFFVSKVIAPIPGTGFFGFFPDYQLTTTKLGAATSVTDPNPACPSGTISSNAGTGSVTRTQPM